MKLMPRHLALLSAAIGSLATLGCGQAPQPRFQLNMVRMVTSEVNDQSQQEIANVLAALFGTPDEPYAPAETGLDPTRLKLAAGAAWRRDDGVGHGLYRRHCVHCHGISGDGRGPTALFLNPYPRDYRLGKFKFKSTTLAARPTDADLTRVLHNGVPGTSMPAFSTLPPSEVESLVEYVKYLAMRGEMETRLAAYVASELGEVEEEDANGDPILVDGKPKMKHLALDPAGNAEHAAIIKEELDGIVVAWQEAADSIVQPKEEEIPVDNRSPQELAASIAAGRELFYNARGNCFSCHGPTGLGDGQQTDFDDWAAEQKGVVDGITQLADSIAKAEEGELDEDGETRVEEDRQQLARLQAVAETFYPLRNAIPRNLRKGVYRGGRRRIDLFHRFHQGIAGTKMPGLASTLTEAELWNIVDYVLSLPYEPTSAPQSALMLNPKEIN